MLKVRSELLNLKTITTTNRSDNIPILKINRSLGFTPKYWLGNWTLHLDNLVTHLTVRPQNHSDKTGEFLRETF